MITKTDDENAQDKKILKRENIRLELSIKEDMQGYVQEAITEIFGEELDKKIDDKIDEKIQSMDNTQIQNLF